MVVSEAQKRTQEHLLELIESFAGTGQSKTKEGGDMTHALGGLVGEHLEVGEQLGGLVGEHLEVGEQLLRRSSSPEMAEELQFWKKLRERADQTAPLISDQPHNEYFSKNAIERHLNEI